jgi:hypothetical protein
MVMGEGEEGDGGRSGGEGGVEVVWDMYGWSKRNTFSYAFYAVPDFGKLDIPLQVTNPARRCVNAC